MAAWAAQIASAGKNGGCQFPGEIHHGQFLKSADMQRKSLPPQDVVIIRKDDHNLKLYLQQEKNIKSLMQHDIYGEHRAFFAQEWTTEGAVLHMDTNMETVWTAFGKYAIISDRYRNHYENGGFLYVFKGTA
jgi:hypothetical protein